MDILGSFIEGGISKSIQNYLLGEIPREYNAVRAAQTVR